MGLAAPQNKSLFASFSSEKEDSCFLTVEQQPSLPQACG
jgi:hypothetical protein